MKIYDISQELFSCCVWPSDPIPKREVVCSIKDGSVCNVTAFSMCAHNGTHIDAPYHFFDDGITVDEIPLYKTVGECYVCHFDGIIDRRVMEGILKKATTYSDECAKRILVGGTSTLSEDAARLLAEKKIYLYGNEGQTVGPEDAPMATHLIMLGEEIVLLEGVRLNGVPEGKYPLNAAPINLEGSDGAPCRAILIEQ